MVQKMERTLKKLSRIEKQTDRSNEMDAHEKYLGSRKSGGQRRRENIKRDKVRNESKYF